MVYSFPLKYIVHNPIREARPHAAVLQLSIEWTAPLTHVPIGTQLPHLIIASTLYP